MEKPRRSSRSKSTSLPFDADNTNNNELDHQTSSRFWNVKNEGFPPGVTVDELKQYRRKRLTHPNRPTDNLHVEEGSLKELKTEYNRRFYVPSNTLRSELQKPVTSIHTGDFPMDFSTEKLEKFIAFPNAERSKSLRRNTALKLEGEMTTETEFRREFHPHADFGRVRAFKRENNLKIEGLFETLTTEQKEKYISYLNSRRSTLTRRETELKLDGALDFGTECKSKYANPGSQPRVLVRKRSTSLKLDGETEFFPEYRQSFVDFPRSRPSLIRPHGNLYSEGELDLGTEFRTQFKQPLLLPHSDLPVSAKTDHSLLPEGDLSWNPEYREKFIAHGRSKSEIIRRSDNLNLEGDFTYETENSKYIPSFATADSKSTANKSSSENKPHSFSRTEYHSKYLDFPRQRPQIQKPAACLENSGALEMTTEKRSEYRSYGNVPRTTYRRRPASMQPEGGFQGTPEYREKFIEFPLSFQKCTKPQDSFSREYSSFQVIDVKQAAIPSARKEYSPTPSSPTTDQPPSYRLEVHNVDSQPIGFHKSPERIFPSEAAISKPFASPNAHQAAIEAAIKRRESHQRNSPRIRGSANIHGSKQSCALDENGNDRAFTVLDNVPVNGGSAETWPPVWNENPSVPLPLVS